MARMTRDGHGRAAIGPPGRRDGVALNPAWPHEATGETKKKIMRHQAQALGRRRDSSLKRAAPDKSECGFKPLAIPAVAAAVNAGSRPQPQKLADREIPAILRHDDFVD